MEIWKLGTYHNPTNVQTMPNGNSNEDDTGNEQNDKQNTTLEQDTTDKLYREASIDNKKISLKLKESPVKLISVQTKKRKQLLSCELSPTGEYIFYSTNSDVRLLKLEIVSMELYNNY